MILESDRLHEEFEMERLETGIQLTPFVSHGASSSARDTTWAIKIVMRKKTLKPEIFWGGGYCIWLWTSHWAGVKEGENEWSLEPSVKTDQLLSLAEWRIWGRKSGMFGRRGNGIYRWVGTFAKDFWDGVKLGLSHEELIMFCCLTSDPQTYGIKGGQWFILLMNCK